MSRETERFWRGQAGDIYLGEKEGGGSLFIKRSDLDAHAHFLGPTRTGKTRALQLLAEQLIEANDCSVVILDPHDGPPPYGGLFHALKSYCYDRDHAQRLITIDPSSYHDHHMVTGFNPLARGRSPIVRAGLGVEHLRAVVGHGDQSFATQPMLARWGFNTFLGLIACGLAMADAWHVLNLSDPTFRRGFAEILASEFPDVASDWRWLVEQEGRGRGRDIIDDKLGSTTSRLRFYTTTEVLRAMLSTRSHVLDAQEVLREKKIVLANLNPQGLMLREDQRMLGIQLLHTLCRAAMERTDDAKAPCYLIVDEFSEFVTPEVLEILDGRSKFGLHLILAHQHLSQLQNLAAQDWRYYHAVLTNARLRVVFGGLASTDAATITEHLYGPHLDPQRVKQEIYRTIQTSHLEWMAIRSHTTMSASSTGRSDASSHGSTNNQSEGIAGPPGLFGGMGATPSSFSQGYGSALSHASMSGQSQSDSEGAGDTESLVPVIRPSDPMQELSSREFMKLEEQLFEHAAKLRLQPNQHAILQVRGDYPIPFRVGDVPDPSATQDDVKGPDSEILRGAPWAVDLDTVAEEAHERQQAFRQLVGEREDAALPSDRFSAEEYARIPAAASAAPRAKKAVPAKQRPARKRTTGH